MKTEQKYPDGTRVKVSVGHPMIEYIDGELKNLDFRPEYTNDTATVVGTYASKYGGADNRSYILNFDKHGRISWFDEDVITAI